jgi:hypothetical protein
MEAETSKTELARALLDAKMTTNEFSEYRLKAEAANANFFNDSRSLIDVYKANAIAEVTFMYESASAKL